MTQKTFYKVVRSTNKGLVSARLNEECQYNSVNHIKINYRTQRWVKPRLKNSKIFVFASLTDAQKFADKEDKENIYECEVKNPEVAKEMCYSTYNITIYWINKGMCLTKEPPAGTYLCDAIKLLRRIE